MYMYRCDCDGDFSLNRSAWNAVCRMSFQRIFFYQAVFNWLKQSRQQPEQRSMLSDPSWCFWRFTDIRRSSGANRPHLIMYIFVCSLYRRKLFPIDPYLQCDDWYGSCTTANMWPGRVHASIVPITRSNLFIWLIYHHLSSESSAHTYIPTFKRAKGHSEKKGPMEEIKLYLLLYHFVAASRSSR